MEEVVEWLMAGRNIPSIYSAAVICKDLLIVGTERCGVDKGSPMS
jgi:hypothetical protein